MQLTTIIGIVRTLVLGGTRFLSRAVAEEAVRRGHEVVCAARGESGPFPGGARPVRVDREAPDGLAPLAGEHFDAVVDVARTLLPVREALRVLGATAGHWTFVSTINVYSDPVTPGQGPGSPLLEPCGEEIPADRVMNDSDIYGAVKVACENAVREAAERAFVVRPGLITGPGDVSDRFGYWPARFSRGGQVVVPGVPNQSIQHIDVRDLATWIVDAGEQRILGTFDAVGPPRTLGPLLDEVAGLVAPPGTTAAALAPEELSGAGVNPWGGPRSLPLWLPDTHQGLAAHDASASLGAGLRPRPLADTVFAALGTERALGLDRERRAGLTAREEAAVLRAER